MPDDVAMDPMSLPEAVRMDDAHRQVFLAHRAGLSHAMRRVPVARGPRAPYKPTAPPSQAPCRAWDERVEYLSDAEFQARYKVSKDGFTDLVAIVGQQLASKRATGGPGRPSKLTPQTKASALTTLTTPVLFRGTRARSHHARARPWCSRAYPCGLAACHVSAVRRRR
jgi:hypothetical protein